jgi:hypothetical protein
MTCTSYQNYSCNQIEKNEMSGACSTYGGEESVLMGKPDGMKPLGRHRRRWECNITMDLQEVGWGAWSGLIWLRIGTGGRLL